MAEGNDESQSLSSKSFKKKKTKINFSSWYKQIQEDCPSLKKNKKFLKRKGNSQEVTCSLCNIGIELSKNTSVLKSALLNHVEDKYHKKQYNASVTKNPNQSDSSVFVPVINDFETIYDGFNIYDPVIKTSKQFIAKSYNNNNYFCALCNKTILYSTEMHKFRYNLWAHMNKESHREKLPNYNEIEKEFQDTMSYLSKTHAPHLKHELKYFKIGPIYKYVSCSLCQLAIHAKAERLVEHLGGDEHKRNLISKCQKRKEIKEGTWKEPENTPTLDEKNKTAFEMLMAKIDSKFKEQLKFFVPGKMPGYVVCNLCTCVLLPTKSCIEIHICKFHQKKQYNASDSEDPNQSDSLVCDPVTHDFKAIYDCFDKDNPVVKTSKQFIAKNYDNNNYFCELCNETILYSTELHKFRYNLWNHMNKESHREKLPNFDEVEKHFQDTMLYLSQSHAPKLKLELKYFKIGPIYKHVSCSLCQLAIHAKPERLLNHLMGEEHQINLIAKRQKQKEMKEGTRKERENTPTLAKKTQTAFEKLMTTIDTKFKKKLKFIEPGIMPGYVVCNLCTCVLLPTKSCIEIHIDKFHKHHP